MTSAPPAPSPAPPQPDTPPAPPSARPLSSFWRDTARVGAAFCALVAVVLMLEHVRIRANAPLKSPRLTALKARLRTAPKDEALKEQIRALDLQLRREYFRRLGLTQTGAWLMVGSAVLWVLAARQSAGLRASQPLPRGHPDAAREAARAARLARWAVGVAGLLAGAGLGAVVLTGRTRLPADAPGVERLLRAQSGEGDTPVAWPSPAEIMAQWPRFLGPGGNSFSPCTNPPVAWDVATGTNILWRSPVAAPGFGSPVIWSNQVFLSGGTAAARSVCCYHATNGALVWQRPVEGVPGSPTPVPSVPESTGFAAATVATDGRHVYAIFANGDLVAFALDGRRVWAKAFGALKNAYGHGASLVAGQGRLLVQLDHGDREAGLSRLYSLDALTGRVVWERSRPVPSSWATPLAVETPGRAQVVTLAEPFIIAYAAADGTELWRAECLSGEVTSSPIWAGGLVLAISPNEKLLALRADGQGDVTKSHVLWTVEDMMPDIASPASDGELAYTATSTGVIACYEVKTGKEQWKQELGQPVNASPALAGGHLYVFTRKGTAVVAEAGRQFKELARNEMGSAVFASPAWARDRLVVRTATELVCIATGAARGGRP